MQFKRFSLVLLVLFFSASMIFALGSAEQAKPESGITEAQPSQEQRVAPSSKGELYYSFSGITKKVLPSVVVINGIFLGPMHLFVTLHNLYLDSSFEILTSLHLPFTSKLTL